MSNPQDGGESSSSSPESTPAVVHSSAAFLHHLHTDPSSHHITLSATTNRRGGTGPSKSPKSLTTPLEPTVVERNKPTATPRQDSSQSSTSPDPVVIAGPSSLRAGLSRSGSKKGRPTSAPAHHDFTAAYSTSFSPDVEDATREDFPFEGSSGENLPHLLSGGDVCVSDLISDVSDAEQGMELAKDGESADNRKSRLLGIAGSFERPKSTVPAPERSQTPPDQEEQLGWNTFAKSYAHGLFDPNKIPNPPQPSFSPIEPSSVHSSPGKRYVPSSVAQRRSGTTATTASGSSRGTLSSSASGSSAATLSTLASSAPSTSLERPALSSANTSTAPTQNADTLPAKMKAMELETLPASPKQSMKPDKLKLPSYSLAAATVRMASSNLRNEELAPLGMPSPERELLDPMASMVSADLLTHESKESASSDPGQSRFHLHRSMSSTVGPSNVHQTLLPTIQASPVSTPSENSHKAKGKALFEQTKISPSRVKGGIVGKSIPPASAPIERTVETESTTDYFGSMASPHYSRQPSYNSHSSSSQTATERGTPLAPRQPTSPNQPSPKSSPSSSPEFQLPALAHSGDVGPLFEKLGWLPAPLPPNELERRKALYRYNILHTSKDVNFDRIAHMTKLVFNTKIVLIALTDAESQWHKSQTGLGVNEAARITSFCSHTILSKTDEPFVVLDTQLDWRFANNPQVLGFPHIRFYAGAPLRTSEGYNLGSLCIVDDKPRTEFPPRSRLILKEFAAVTMREMELWRDKLQLRVRDKIQTSMEQFTRECLEMDAGSSSNAEAAAKMDQVYARAAQLVCSTLDLDGCFVLDIGQFEMTEVETASGSQLVFRADPYTIDSASPVLERSDTFGPVNPFPVLATTPNKVPTRPLSAVEHEKLSTFLRDNRDGRIFENIAPSWIRYMFPPGLRYGMVVPVFGVDQQPFAMICAYNCNKAKQYLEGYELQFLRAIGVIILSAVLRRRMVLADKTKSILISSVSHELRTPLHGILAAAELLSDTKLDANQLSFLKTVTTCGNSLIETVNHVLDFTKLSGSAQSASGTTIRHSRVNLASLVESTVESCWIGQRARFFHGDSDIGSFYAPEAPSAMIPKSQRDTVGAKMAHVETIIDIGQRERGWAVRCERGGLRRVLMNLVGNSLKFTTDGYVHVSLRELPHPPGAKKIPIEMAVVDTGKGISKEFLKDHLFHPFSQENPLQTGTGLGLAIVNSIVRSESVDGKVDVWSSEGRGTEIRVSFEAEVIDDEDDASSSASSVVSMSSTPGRGHSVSFLGFSTDYRGHVLSLDCLSSYAAGWQFELKEARGGGILIINDDGKILEEVQDSGKPIIFITTGRNCTATAIRDRLNAEGGLMQIMYKPIGPSAFRGTLLHAVDFLENGDQAESHDGTTPSLEERERPSMSRGSSGASAESNSTVSELSHKRFDKYDSRVPLMRRRSEENEAQPSQSRPRLAPRGITYHHAPKTGPVRDDSSNASSTPSFSSGSPQPGSPTSTISTISLADGGVMLKSAAVSMEAVKRERVPRVMIVEDNVINRTVLGAYLKKKGAEYYEAVDGKAGVDLFEGTPPNYWDVILMDISMPNMNGHEATRAIRRIEATRRNSSEVPVVPPPGTPVKIPPPRIVQARAKIFALTGLATADDKREAFGSGVDGYLVKPVSLKSLGLIFQKIGFPIDLHVKAESS